MDVTVHILFAIILFKDKITFVHTIAVVRYNCISLVHCMYMCMCTAT